MRKIFITGCAKSGTTLLKDLFRSFENTYVIEQEISIGSFVRLNQKQVGDVDFVVGKRTWDTIYSCGRLRDTDIASQYYALQKAGVVVINVVRDGRNVVRSMVNDWGWHNPFEWMECVRQWRENNGIITLQVRYEDLLAAPNLVQSRIILATEMVKEHPFSDYPDFIQTTEQREKNYTFRPLDKNKILPDTETYLHHPNDVEHFDSLLKELGYE